MTFLRSKLVSVDYEIIRYKPLLDQNIKILEAIKNKDPTQR